MRNLLRSLSAALLLAVSLPACESAIEGDEQNVVSGSSRFETFVGEDGQHYFQLVASNGERVLASEGYSSLSAAKAGITSVKKNGLIAARFQLLQTDGGEAYFNLLAANGEVIGTSQTYTTTTSAKTGIAAVKKALENPTSTAAQAGSARFQTFTGLDKKTYFRLLAKNGQIVLQSQGYASKSSATSGIASVKKSASDATNFQIFEGLNGQHTFRLVASNGKTIGRGEMYADKSGALRGAAGVRELVRELAGGEVATDAEVQAEIEKASVGLLFTSESDYPFEFVSAPAATAGSPVDEALVRKNLGSFVEADEAADKPMASLFGMESPWQDWKNQEHNCSDPSDPASLASCNQMRNLEQVLEANLTDVHVFYFGAKGSAGKVDGIGVSVFIIGRTPAGTLAGVRTLAIWT